MTGSHVSAALRRDVTERANGRCEYCQYPSDASLLGFEIEHIIAEKHGGVTSPGNLALACPFCNRAKGSDLASIDPETGELTAFFNPRTQNWLDHFQLDGPRIVPRTATGRVTVIIFQINHPDRLLERGQLIRVGRYSGI
jgi:hypothetical protein